MPKVLTDEKYRALKAKADGYDGIVASIVQTSEDLKPEDVTLETIQEVISSGTSNNDAEMTELNTKLENMTSERDTLQTQVTDLTEENSKLKDLPGAETVTKEKPKSDAQGKEDEDTLLSFAQKHAGDTMAILTEMKKNGYEPQKTA